MTTRLSRVDLIWPPIVLAAMLLVYLPGLHHPLLFDDSILTEELFAVYGSLSEMRARMLSYGSFVWVRELFGEGWWKQRLVNVAIHAAVVVALWALYRELLRHVEATGDAAAGPAAPYERSPALPLAIGFFALNPAAVYGVAYLIQRSILMATFFVVLALWLFARALATRRPWLHALAVASYALAVASKEHALLAPLAAVPLYILVARPGGRRLAAFGAGLALLVAAAGWVLWSRYGEIIGKPFDEYSHAYLAQLEALRPGASAQAFPLSILNQAYLFFEYGLRWFIPASGWMSINLRPPFPVTLLSFPHLVGALGYAAVLIGGFWVLVRCRDWRALAAVAVLVPALLFATEFATVWVQDPFVLYRSYLWAIGVPGLAFLALHGPSPRVLAVVAIVLGSLLTWQAFDRVASLGTAERAWSDAIAKLPDDPRSVGRWFPYLNRGTEYVEASQFTLAMRDFEASSVLGDLGMGAFNRGALLSASGRHREALAAFDEAQKQGYDLYNLPVQRALALLALARFPEAYEQLRLAQARNPPSPTREVVLLHLGRTALQLGKREEAIAPLQQLLSEQPGNAEARFVLAMAYISGGQHARGLELADALVRSGGGGLAYYARALAHHGLGRKREALADIEAAVRLVPGNANLREWHEKIKAMR